MLRTLLDSQIRWSYAAERRLSPQLTVDGYSDFARQIVCVCDPSRRPHRHQTRAIEMPILWSYWFWTVLMFQAWLEAQKAGKPDAGGP